MKKSSVVRLLTIAGVFTVLAACGGGGGGGGGGGSAPAPAPQALSASPKSLSILGTGIANDARLTVTEINYSGSFTATLSSACAGIISISPNVSAGTFEVTPLGAGSCTITVSDSKGVSTTVQAGVTTTTVGGT